MKLTNGPKIGEEPPASITATEPEFTADQLARPGGEKQTAKKAIELLCELDPAFRAPGRAERIAIGVAFAMRQRVVYGAAFDLVRCSQVVDWSNAAAVADALDSVMLYEVKSTNKQRTREDFGGYFFDLTTAELLVAQSLGPQYRFAFVNIITRSWIDLSLPEVFAKARKIYPKWAVLF